MSTNHLNDKFKIAERKDRSHVSVVEVDTVARKVAKNARGLADDVNVSTEINQQPCPSSLKMRRRRRPLTGKVSYPCCRISCFYSQYKGLLYSWTWEYLHLFICSFLVTDIQDWIWEHFSEKWTSEDGGISLHISFEFLCCWQDIVSLLLALLFC